DGDAGDIGVNPLIASRHLRYHDVELIEARSGLAGVGDAGGDAADADGNGGGRRGDERFGRRAGRGRAEAGAVEGDGFAGPDGAGGEAGDQARAPNELTADVGHNVAAVIGEERGADLGYGVFHIIAAGAVGGDDGQGEVAVIVVDC